MVGMTPTPQAGAPAPGATQGQPPPGSSPASTPVPNRGEEVAGLAQLGIIVRLMEKTVPLLPAGTEAGRDLLQCLSRLAKHVPPGAISSGVEQAALQKLALQQRQNQSQIAAQRAAMAPPAAPGAMQ